MKKDKSISSDISSESIDKIERQRTTHRIVKEALIKKLVRKKTIRNKSFWSKFVLTK